MKLTLLPFLFLAMNIQVFSQTGIWMIPVEANDINLRNPDPTVLDSITINCPTNGKVLVRFDGNCTSTPGDHIILAASDIRDWGTNDGNTAIDVYDANYNLTCFDHTRLYNVETGIHSFYAVAHNYAGTEGTGFASIKGNLTVEFVPDTLTEQALAATGINDCCWNWDNWIHLFPSTTIEAIGTGKLLVNFEGYIDMPWESQLLYTTNLEPMWPANPVVFPVNLPVDNSASTVMHREIFSVNAGEHTVHGLVKFITGDSTNTNHYLYSTLSAQFIPDADPDIQLKSQSFDDHLVAATGPSLLGQVQFTNTEAGKAWLHITGTCRSSLKDRIRIWMVPSLEPDSVFSDISLQPVLASYPDINFSLSGLQEVAPGTHTYNVMLDYDNTSAGTLEGDILGLFTLQFIANPIPSRVNDLTHDDSFSVFPNPTTDKIYVSSSRVNQHDPIEITILNSSGQQINHQTVSDLNQYNHDLSNLPDGEYLVQIKQGTLVGVKTVVKTK